MHSLVALRMRVYIIVLNWNQAGLTIDCVRSLRALDYPDYRVVVVDNGSQDGSVQKLRAEFGDWIHIIANQANLGFAGGNNVGIAYALERGADYVMLLNNDTIANDPHLVTKLVEVMARDPSIGQTSPSIYYLDEPDRVWCAGGRLDLWRGWRVNTSLPSDLEPCDTGWATGCCVLASRRMIQHVGALQAKYFLCAEDIEWSLRAKRQGWRAVYVPTASLLHKESASSRAAEGKGMYSPMRVYFNYRNAVWLVRAYGNLVQRWFVWPIRFALRWSYQIAGYLVLRRWDKLAALLRAIRDGVLAAPPGP